MPFILKLVKLAMNIKTKYMIPAFAAVFALMFVIATPYVMAEGAGHAKWASENHQNRGHHAILVEGFTGTIQLPEEMTPETHDSLKNQVTVSLGQAVSMAESKGVTDAMKASIGIVENGEGNKYVVWTVTGVNRDVESKTMTANIFVVDAGNLNNFTTVTKTFDHSEMKGKMHGDKTAKFEKFQQKFSEPTGDADVDAARAKFLDLTQQLRDAIKNGDTDAAQAIKQQLKELKPSLFLNMRSSDL
jgi:hypothetical protein